jgi:hypothetical protein
MQKMEDVGVLSFFLLVPLIAVVLTCSSPRRWSWGRLPVVAAAAVVTWLHLSTSSPLVVSGDIVDWAPVNGEFPFTNLFWR